MRSEVGIDFKKVYASSQATHCTLQLGEEIILLESCSRQTQKAKCPVTRSRCRTALQGGNTHSILDHLVSELNTKFSSISEISHLEGLIPSDFSNHTVEESVEIQYLL